MPKPLRLSLSALVVMALVVLALWLWGQGEQVAAGNPVRLWAWRSFGMSLAAAAQVLLLRSVVAGIYPRRTLDAALQLSALLILLLAGVSAAALALAGR